MSSTINNSSVLFSLWQTQMVVVAGFNYSKFTKAERDQFPATAAPFFNNYLGFCGKPPASNNRPFVTGNKASEYKPYQYSPKRWLPKEFCDILIDRLAFHPALARK